jgi:hypothetical protein
MTSKDFDWYGDSESVVIRHQPAIAVYLNPHDEVVIRQEGQYDDGHWIYVTRANALKVAEAILEAAGIENCAEAAPLPLSAPNGKTATERMRRYRNKRRNVERNTDVTEGPQLRLVAAE